MSATFKIRDYSKDTTPKQEGVFEVVPRRFDTNDKPIACDHCRNTEGPLIRVGAHYRVFLCWGCTKQALEQLEVTPMFVIKREDGKFVTKPGQEHSYTSKLQQARTWPSYDDAKRDCCADERIVPLLTAMHEG